MDHSIAQSTLESRLAIVAEQRNPVDQMFEARHGTDSAVARRCKVLSRNAKHCRKGKPTHGADPASGKW